MNVNDILTFQLFTLKGTAVTVASVLTALVIIVGGWLASHLIQKAAKRGWDLRGGGSTGGLHAMLRLMHYAIMLVVLGIALETLGVDLTTLFAAGAIFAIGLGFAMQNIAQNFVAGVILLVERSIKPGDLLEVEGTVVRVQRMGLRATLVRTRLEEEMIVPNSVLVQSTIKNFTLHDPLYRARTSVGVAYNSDLRTVRQALEEAATSLDSRFAGRDPLVLLTGFGDNAVQFEVSVWTNDAWAERRLLSDLNDRIWWKLKEAGVTIAFPQRDLHVDKELIEAIRSLNRGEPDAEPRKPREPQSSKD
jgi:small-conductance mechanosensitive channel